MSEIAFGRETTCSLTNADAREWLVTNGIGGFASGTLSGILTRRYHGLLIASLKPPLERTLLASKIDEEALYDGTSYPLSANRWGSEEVSPTGFIHIEKFVLDGSIPTWTFAIGDALLEKRIWMEQGANTTYVLYTLLRGQLPLSLTLKCLVNYRGYHTLTRANGWKMQIDPLEKGFTVKAFDKAVPFTIESDTGKAVINNIWYGNYLLSKERERGLDCNEDNLLAGTFTVTLKEGESTLIAISTDKPTLDAKSAFSRRKSLDEALLKNIKPWWIRQLHLAADQFLVEKAIIAGYPWFSDWGRDTMVSLTGLTLVTKRFEKAKAILMTYADRIDQGMLPDYISEEGTAYYNTADAAFWFFKAVRDTFEATKDLSFLRVLFPKLQEIIDWTLKGTRYNIHVDEKDGLLYAGETGVQLTWMDVKIGTYVVTPRIGKPVEINALWYNALRSMSHFAEALGLPSSDYDRHADKCKIGFQRFFDPEKNYCFDVLDTPQGNDASLRPNQLFAVSLRESPLSPEQQRSVVDAVSSKLYTTYGIRSLSPDDKQYIGRYGGGPLERDGAYHQGTAWGFLLGVYALAHLKVYQDPVAVEELLSPIQFHLKTAGLGTFSEIFDGNAPHSPRGCLAQAWSVGTLLEAYAQIEKKN